MNQSFLPAKTKFVAWAMIIIGVISGSSLLLGILFSIYANVTKSYALLFETTIGAILLMPSAFLISGDILSGPVGGVYPLLPYFLFTIILILLGFSFFKRKSWAWWGTLSFLIIEICYVTYRTYKIILDYPATSAFGDILNPIFNPTLYISGILIILLVLDKNNYLKQLAKS